MAELAIKGHPTRGKEVIQLLEMLGANRLGYKDTFVGFYYYIECGAICSSDEYPTYSTIFTLEEFLEKYPYKVGDKVKVWVNGYRGVFNIQDITWDSITKKIKYRIHDYWYSVENLQPYKEETMKEKTIPPYMDYDIKEGTEKNYPPKTQAEVDKYLQEHSVKNAMNVVDIETCLETDGLKLPENVVINSKGIGSIQFIQWYEKTKYPKTYEECCQVFMGKTDFQDFELVLTRYAITRSEENSISLVPPHISLINNFYKLLICRDAYWKIAGEQMGLGKPWEPDWGENDGGYRYCIRNRSNKIVLSNEWLGENYILSFPTAEMQDEFYKNFKDLIEQCKELL